MRIFRLARERGEKEGNAHVILGLVECHIVLPHFLSSSYTPILSLQPAQVFQSLFSTDFPLADKILNAKHQQDHFYVVHRA